MRVINGDYGLIKVDEGGAVVEIERGKTDQGYVYKNEEAFIKKEGVCYIPETSDLLYTHEDILAICEGDKSSAQLVFDDIDWQLPETRYEEIRCQED